MVVRVMLMVPIYAVSSLISLFSLDVAFIIDAIRDVYEAFVIYCFFQLLLGYLGGERSLLILVHGRQPKAPPFPMNVFQRELDVSDPYTFLFLKRGILQYVQLKPLLAIASLALKASGKYNEGEFRIDSGYLYVSIVYNISICLSLYCLAMFWLSINEDLKPYRPMPKFLCVKGILFFSFWQATGVSLLVSLGAIKRLGPYTDKEHISLGLTDTLICLEMPFFAIAHLVAFSYHDYIDNKLAYVGRMPMRHAFRDAFGFKDVFEDARATLDGQGMDYREFEPSEGQMHQGLGRGRRIRAGLRYSRGGRRKYWLPQVSGPNPIERTSEDSIHEPLLTENTSSVHQVAGTADEETLTFDLTFRSLDPEDEELFTSSRQYLFGDYNYPCIDASSEAARAEMWDEEERILSNERSAWFADHHGHRVLATTGYGAVGVSGLQQDRSCTPSIRPSFVAADDPKTGLETIGDRESARYRRKRILMPRLGLGASPSSVISHVQTDSVSTTPGHTAVRSRPDAVDLVTEDHRTPGAVVAHEYQHTEPESYDARRPVSRWLVSPPEVGADVRGETDSSLVQSTAHWIAEETGTEARVAAGIVVRFETPPQAQPEIAGAVNLYDDDENPWT
ncbi:organic solute transporter Ostalpha-domain-containing protein [Lactarius akahatsu]|uniref:Organic solute transporter Ostalpha-domain-containing protein n=1 Tax=Lactarius akahatsu TaxID=416441 RepID=A0AAD4LMR7_9AGAM|nr:organic solute transporter Ostalpha-domain-containing protein [Lactarius akahatsu]